MRSSISTYDLAQGRVCTAAGHHRQLTWGAPITELKMKIIGKSSPRQQKSRARWLLIYERMRFYICFPGIARAVWELAIIENWEALQEVNIIDSVEEWDC